MNCDVLIIGTGIAGLTTGIILAEKGLSVVIATRSSDPRGSNTYWAQGGIIYPQNGDNQLREDILKASSRTSNLSAISVIEERGREIFEEILLRKIKTSFSKDHSGNIGLTREAAHSLERIAYRDDFSGQEILTSLLRYLKDDDRFPNVTFLESHTAIDLLTPLHHGVSISQRYESDRVVGAYLFDQKQAQVKKCLSRFTVLATGGIGALYLHNSNSEGARGDGHAMAKRAGAILTDMEFIQFHPTTFFNRQSHRRFLVSEALRGEGGILVNCKGERFMESIHLDKELAPRDIVARAIADQIITSEHECVYLDISHKEGSWIQQRFPTIYQHCLSYGLDITKSPIPVVPAAHYSCGGIKTDLKGRTSLQGLYAVGEVACTGLHGANRLASTSLLEGLVFGHIAGENIVECFSEVELYESELIKEWFSGSEEADAALIQQDWLTLKQTMWNYVGLSRSSNRLARANAMMTELIDEIERFYKKCLLTDGLIGLRNSVEVGKMVLDASRRNHQSIGCFFRN